MIKKIFWNGIKAFVPMALTFVIVIWIFENLENFFGRLLRHVIPAEYYFPGMGILVGTATIFAIGILVNSWILKYAYLWVDDLVRRIPVIKTIYNVIKDVLGFFDKSKEAMQNQAVIVQTPAGKVIGFITRSTLEGLPLNGMMENHVIVYIPLSYILGGTMMIVSRENITPIEWPAEKALSFIVTAGMATQPTLPS